MKGTIMACAMLELVQIMAFTLSFCVIRCICALCLSNWLCYLSQLIDNVATVLSSGLKVPSNNNSGLQVRLFYDSLMLII
jgi:uncharacterized membrane protein